MSYKAKDVIREVDNGSTGELDRMVFKNHHTPEDFNDGDIQERIDQFDYYHLVEIDLHKIDRGKQPRPKGRGFSCVQTTLD